MSLLWNIALYFFSATLFFLMIAVWRVLWEAYKDWSPRWDIRRPENDPEIKYREMKKKRKEGKK